MDHFYVMGRQAALEKLGGLLGSAAEAWKGLAPGTRGLTKRLGAGGTAGALLGADTGGEGNRGTGALLGGIVGAGGMAGAGHLARKGMQKQVGETIKSMSKNMRPELGRSLKPSVMREQGALMPSFERIRPDMPSWEHLKATAKAPPVG